MNKSAIQSAEAKAKSEPKVRSSAVLSGCVHFSSATPEWSTPQEFFDRLNARYNFTLDPCCTHANAKCARHYTAAENGLAQSWQNERVWMNPPYGRAISAWMKKAYDESRGSALVVCLVPARTDTAWWHDYAAQGEITFVRGRLKFGGQKNSAPFPSAVIVLKPLNAVITRERSESGSSPC